MFTRTWDVFADLTRLQKELQGLTAAPQSYPAEPVSWQPRVDIHEDAERVLLVADLPGVDQNDLEISLDKGLLKLAGERKLAEREAKNGYRRVERIHGRFARTFTVSELIDAEKITATLKEGVLTVTLPKRAEAQPRRINVAVGN